MANRPKQSLMDYMVIGISPALIMAMVGSLLFYLLMVFYQGQYGGRLTFIFAMFVMAIVLIARISMEEGIEYATLFAVPLAIVTMMAMSRFVRIDGPLASYSMMINVGLIALVWWSAHKLTWDCTLIDDDQDSSGEGLLQGMGFDEDTVESQAVDSAESSAGEAGNSPTSDATTRKTKKSELPLWWQRMVNRRHRPHTPGVWVIYYAIAALPLFALGQWMIPAEDSARLAGFRWLVIYVGSALGLLLTTSFLGLRRYLRQRKLEMPTDMASMWLGIGTIMILVLLLVCVVLPRPGAALKISQVPVSFGSPDHDRTHDKALGNDGPEKPQQANRTRQDAKKSGPNAPTKKGAKGKPESSSKGASSKGASSKGASKSGSKGEDKQSGKSSDGQQNRDDSKQSGNGSEKGKQTGAKNQGESKAESGKSASKNDADKSGDNQAGSKQSKAGEKGRSQRQEAGKGDTTNDQEPPDQKANSQQENNQQDQQQDANDQQAQENRQEGSRREQTQQQTQRKSSQQSQSERKQSSSSQSPSQPSAMSRALSGLVSSFGTLLKLLFWAVLIGVVAYFAWKYRDRVMQAIRQLIEDLKNLLANLFGGRRDHEETEDEAAGTREAVRLKPFSSYTDPFVSGGAERYSTEQLVRYTFEAMEAWGRDRACPRGDEQTPLEFARHLAVEYPNLGVEAQQLSDLYSRVAYGHERVDTDRRELLQQFWRQMRATAAMPAPPPAELV